jgi:radical SAM protein with 4Fe4S-binding SPASM domain
MKSETCESNVQETHDIASSSLLYAPQVVQLYHDGIYLMIDPNSPNWASFNALGSSVIRHCDGKTTLSEITAAIGIEYGLTPVDVRTFIERAADAGFIATAPTLSPPYPGRSQVIAPGTLEELWVYTNQSCPLHCIHCLVDAGKDSVPPMPAAEIRRLADEAVALGAKRLYFTGGEPFMRQDIMELAGYVAKKAQLVILTSGVLITSKIAARLKADCGDNLTIQLSLEGPDASTNDAMRGAGSFERAVRGIHYLLDAGIVPIITTTLTALNYERAADTTRFLASLGIKDHHILWLHERGRVRHSIQELALSAEKIAGTMQQVGSAAKEAGIVVDNAESLAVRVRSGRSHKNDLCNSCYGVLAINSDGHVFPCASVVGTAEFDCGSVRDSNLRDIWLNASKSRWIRHNSVQNRVGCNECYLKFFCGGGCFAQSYFNYETHQGTGCIMAADPYCEVYKSQLIELMWESATPAPFEKNEKVPVLYRNMPEALPACALGSYTTLDAAHDVGTYHCSCVLAMDAENHSGGNCGGK